MVALSPNRLHPQELLAASDVESIDGPLHGVCRDALTTAGKQLRPSILLEAARCGPRPDAPSVRRAAIAIELVHVASLAHDDVVDSAPLRRGRESLPSAHGTGAAVLAGAWLFGSAIELMADCGEPALSRFQEAVATVCEGQLLEVGDLFDVGRSRERCLEVVGAKTGALFEVSAALGGLLAGADGASVRALGRYGWELGVAFQLSDDVLDLVGGDEVTGKRAGSDLRQGLYTLPVVYALECEPGLAARLDGSLDEEGLAGVVEEVVAAGGVARAVADCREHAHTARTLALELEAPPSLVAAADYTIDRCANAGDRAL